MQFWGQKHGGQILLADSVEQQRWLNLIARPVLLAGLSGRSDAAGATSAGATLLSANFALGTPSRIDDSRGMRT